MFVCVYVCVHMYLCLCVCVHACGSQVTEKAQGLCRFVSECQPLDLIGGRSESRGELGEWTWGQVGVTWGREWHV